MYFPITANPIGFNHFAAIEWILRCNPQAAEVVVVLSNGHHPDPTKPDAELSAENRHALAQEAVDAVADPAQSFLALQAELAGEALRLSPERIRLSTVEFAFDRALPTAELVRLIQEQSPQGTIEDHSKMPWLVGSDLIRRMGEARIFPQEQLLHLAASCQYHILQREGDDVPAALEAIKRNRGVELEARIFPVAEMPTWLAPFMALSSTHTREGAEAGDPLGGMLPSPSAARIQEQGYYRPGRPFALISNPDVSNQGRHIPKDREGKLGVFSTLQWRLWEKQRALEGLALRLVSKLNTDPANPRTLALVETSTGGAITALLGAIPGVSKVFLQSQFAYDQASKEALLGGPLPSTGNVSAPAVEALAQAMRFKSGAWLALAESGMAGPPNPARRSLKNGQCWFSVASAERVISRPLTLNPFLTRREHQLDFAFEALKILEDFAN